MSVGIALGGGAPNLTLMTGALSALLDQGVDYDLMTTTGAGMVAGLLYMAPRREAGETVEEARSRALRATREMGVDDLIYEQFPMNFKIFQKPGKLAEAYSDAVNPTIWGIPRETRRQRLLGDTLGLMAAMAQPGYVTPQSTGLCQPPPWIELMVDFQELRENAIREDTAFTLSAYCIEDKKERTFQSWEITREHFAAGLAMPFLYSPYTLTDEYGETKTYLEGSAIRTMQLNPENILGDLQVKTMIYFDLMGNRHLMGEPKHLIDAWGKSIVAPLTQLAYLQEQLLYLKSYVFHLNKLNRTTISKLDEFTMNVEAMLQRHAEESGDQRIQSIAQEFTDMARETYKGRAEIIDDFIDRTRALTEDRVSSEDLEEFFSDGLDELDDDGTVETALLRSMLAVGQEIDRIQRMGGEDVQPEETRILRMPFRNHMPDEQWANVLDWSYSNMSSLYDIGYETGVEFVEKHRGALGLSTAG